MEKKPITRNDLIKVEDFLYEIPPSFRDDMRVSARVFLSEEMLDAVLDDKSLEQLVNVTTLPGIKKHAFAMPDIHQGYGFPIGGLAATAIHEGGVISPGGIGYDINCGVRLLVTSLYASEITPYLENLATALYHQVPSGVGQGGKIDLSMGELDKILKHGAAHAVAMGYGNESDLEYCEERGCLRNADPSLISDRAKKRGLDQLGTLGSGNHFLEVQRVSEIFDEKVAQTFGLEMDRIVVMIHCGSRGLGHQTCTDYVRLMMSKMSGWGIQLPDRELACAPFTSPAGQEYFAAMAAAANFAWANRHVIAHHVREAFKTVIGGNVVINTLYDVSHNIGKLERHTIDGVPMELLIHRKGATRAFGPGRKELPAKYHAVGQPVLIPGTMGTASYVLVGATEGMEKAFGTSCHGAGRKLSRTKAKEMVRGSELRALLESKGIIIRCDSNVGLAEEAPLAYKDVDNVVNVVHGADLAYKVACCKPLAVVKGG
ncbi:MAG TPA: RtcB family protein [Candidatus Dependentiae bacterium]|nr:RtcB family protein [Candidatus Dependentiae bacterium]